MLNKMVKKLVSITLVMIVTLSATSPLTILNAVDLNDDKLVILDTEDLTLNDEGNYEGEFNAGAVATVDYEFSNNYDYITQIDENSGELEASGSFVGTGQEQSVVFIPKDETSLQPEVEFSVAVSDIDFSLSQNEVTDTGFSVNINYEENTDYSDVEFYFTYDKNAVTLDTDKEYFTVEDLTEPITFTYVEEPVLTTVYLNARFTYLDSYTDLNSESQSLTLTPSEETSNEIEDGVVQEVQTVTEASSDIVAATNAPGAITRDPNSENVDLCYSRGTLSQSILTNQEHCLANPIEVENSSFEDFVGNGNSGIPNEDMAAWTSTDSSGKIEVWNDGRPLNGAIYDSNSGDYFIELNFQNDASIYQDFLVNGGETINFSIAHAKRQGAGTDDIKVVVGYPKENPSSNDTYPVTDTIPGGDLEFSSSTTIGEWVYHNGQIVAPVSETGEPYYLRISIASDGTASGNESIGNLLDDVQFVTQGLYDMESTLEDSEDYSNVPTIGTVTATTKHIKGDTLTNPVFTFEFEDNEGNGIQVSPLSGSVEMEFFYTSEDGEKVVTKTLSGNLEITGIPAYNVLTLQPMDYSDLDGIYYTDVSVKFDNQFPGNYLEYKVISQIDYQYSVDSQVNSDPQQYYIVSESTDPITLFCTEVASDVSADSTYQPHCLTSDFEISNPSFETPDIDDANFRAVGESNADGWLTTESSNNIEFRTLKPTVAGPNVSTDGTYQVIEPGLDEVASVYQDFTVAGGENLYYSYSHAGKTQTDDLNAYIAYPDDDWTDKTKPYSVAIVEEEVSAPKDTFVEHSGVIKAPIRADGNTYDLRFGFSHAGNISSANLIDNVNVNSDVVLDEDTTLTDDGNTDLNKRVFTFDTTVTKVKGDTFDNSYMEIELPEEALIDGDNISVEALDEDGNVDSDFTPTYTTTINDNIITLDFGDQVLEGLHVVVDFKVDDENTDPKGTLTAESTLYFYSAPEREFLPGEAEEYWVKDADSLDYETNELMYTVPIYSDEPSGSDSNNLASVGETLLTKTSVVNENSSNRIYNAKLVLTLDDTKLDMSTLGTFTFPELNTGVNSVDPNMNITQSVTDNVVTIEFNGYIDPGVGYYPQAEVTVLNFVPNYDDIVVNAVLTYDGNEQTDLDVDGDFPMELVAGSAVVTKSVSDVDDGLAQSGEELTYTVTVENDGETYLGNVVVNDNFEDINLLDPTAVSVSSVNSNNNYTISSDNKQITIDYIEPGDIFTIVYTTNVATEISEKTGLFSFFDFGPQNIDNVVTVSADNLDDDITASADIEIDANPILGAIVSADVTNTDGTVSTGQTVDFSVSALSGGDTVQQNVIISTDLNYDEDLDYDTYTFVNVTDSDGNVLVEGTDYTVIDDYTISVNSLAPGELATLNFSIDTKDTFDATEFVEQNGKVSSDYSAESEGFVQLPKDLSNSSLDISKVADVSEVEAGGAINYTVDITNDGDITVSDAIFDDSIDATNIDASSFSGYTITSSEGSLVDGSDYVINGSEITFTEIDVNETITITYSYNSMTDFAQNGVEITNTASVKVEAFDIDEEATANVTGIDLTDVSFVKSVEETTTDNNLANFSESLTYTFEVTNNTGRELENSSLSDDFATTLENVTLSSIDIDGTALVLNTDYAYNDGVISGIDIPNDGVLSVVVTADVLSSFESSDLENDQYIQNIAEFSSDEITTPLTSEANIEFDYASAQRVSVDKSLLSTEDGDSLIDPDEEVVYSVLVENTGEFDIAQLDLVEDLSDVNLTDSIDDVKVFNAGVELSLGTDYTFDNDSITIFNLAKDDIIDVQITVTSVSTFTNAEEVNNTITAFVDGEEKDSDTSVDYLDKNITDVSLTNSAVISNDADSDLLVDPSDEVTYSVDIINGSNVEITNVVLNTSTDNLNLANDTLVSVVDSLGNTITTSGGLSDLTIDSIPAGETYTVVFTSTAESEFTEEDNTYNLLSTITFDESLLPVLANDATVTFDYESNTQLSVSKDSQNITNTGQDAVPGDVLEYTITLENTGSAVINDLQVIEDLSDVNLDASTINFTSSSDSSVTFDNSSKTFNVESLAIGQITTITFEVTTSDNYVLSTDYILNRVNVVDSNGYLDVDADNQYPIDLTAIDLDFEKVIYTDRSSDPDRDRKADPGEEAVFDVTVTNNSNFEIPNFVISDVIDTDNITADYIEPTVWGTTDNGFGQLDSSEYSVNGYEVTINSLKPTSSYTVTYVFQTTDTYNNDTGIENTAYGNSDYTDEVTDTVTYPIDVVNNSDVSVSKTVHGEDSESDQLATTNEVLTYNITLENTGTVGLNNVNILDELSDRNLISSASIVSFTLNGDPYSSYVVNSANGLDVTLSELQVGDIVEIELNVTTKPTFSSGFFGFLRFNTPLTIDNTVEVTADDLEKESADASILVDESISSVTIDKEVTDNNDELATAGETLYYTVTIENDGTFDQDNLIITDDLSDINLGTASMINLDVDGTTLVENTDYTITDSTITVNNLLAGQTLVLTYQADVNTNLVLADDISNTVYVNSEYDINEEATAVIPIDLDASRDLILTKSVDAGTDNLAQANEALTYTVTLTNNGDIIENNILLEEDLSDINLTGITTPTITYDIDGSATSVVSFDGTDTFNVATLNPGEVLTITYSVPVAANLSFSTIPTDIVNEITVTTNDTLFTDTANASVEADLASSSSLVVNKTMSVDGDTVDANEVITNTITVENDGSVNQNNVVVTDVISDPSLTGTISNITVSDQDANVYTDGVEYTYNSTDSTFTFPKVDAGTTVTITFETTAASEVGPNYVENTASVTSDLETTEITSTATLETSRANESYTITKSVSDADANNLADNDELLTYNITLENTGSVYIENFVISDIMDTTQIDLTAPETSITVTDINGDPISEATVTGTDISFNGYRFGNGDEINVELVFKTKSLFIGSPLTTTIDNEVELIEGISPDDSILASDNATIPLNIDANLVVSMSVDDLGNPIANNMVSNTETLHYDVNLTNQGNSTLNNIKLTSGAIDENLNDTTFTLAGVYNVTGGTSVLLTDGVDYRIVDGELEFFTIDPNEEILVEFNIKANNEFTAADDIDYTINYSQDLITDDSVNATIPIDKDTLTSYTVNKDAIDSNFDSIAVIGETINYDITVKNTGNIDLSDVSFTDTTLANKVDASTFGNFEVSVGTETVSITPQVSGNVITFTGLDIGVDETAIIKYSMDAVSSFDDMDPIENTVSVDVGDSIAPVSDSASVAIDISAGTDYNMNYFINEVTLDDNKAEPTEQLKYTTEVENSSPTQDIQEVSLVNDFSDVNITDATPTLTELKVYDADGNLVTTFVDTNDADATNDTTTWFSFTDATDSTSLSIPFGDIVLQPGEVLVYVIELESDSTFLDEDVITSTVNAEVNSSDSSKVATINITDDTKSIDVVKSVVDTETKGGGSVPDGLADTSEELNYQVVVTNDGNVELTELSIVDPFNDDRLDNATSVIDSVEILRDGSTITLTDTDYTTIVNGIEIPSLLAGDVLTVNYIVDTTSTFEDITTNINNVVYVHNDDVNSEANVEIPIAYGFDDDIDVTKVASVDGNSLNSGEVIDYTITIDNNTGFKYSDISVVDLLDMDNVDYVIGSIEVSQNGTILVPDVNFDTTDLVNQVLVYDLNPNAELKISYQVQAKDDFNFDTEVINNVSVTNDQISDNTQYTDSESVPIDVAGESDLEILKTATPNDGTTLSASEEVTYTITVTNTGNVGVQNVVVTDVVNDPNLTGVITTPVVSGGNGSSYDATNNQINITSIDAKDVVTITFSTNVTDTFDLANINLSDPKVSNTASVSADLVSEKTSSVETELDISGEPKISSSDAFVKVSDAPANDADLISLLNAQAFDYNGNDISNDITITDFGGYDYSTITQGDYVIEFSVISSEGIEVSTTSTLHVVADTDSTISAEITGNSPVYVQLNDAMNETDVQELIDPLLLAYHDGVLITTDSNVRLIDNGGYDNSVEGTYVFTYEGTYTDALSGNSVTVTNSFDVIVSATESTASAALITALDSVTISTNSLYDPIVTQQASASSTTDGDITSSIQVINNEVDTTTEGYYFVTYYVVDSVGAEAYKTVLVSVVDAKEDEDAIIQVSDYISDTAVLESDLATVMNVKAYDYDGTDITPDVSILDLGGYSSSSYVTDTPYTITYTVTGSSNVIVTNSATLTITSGPVYQAGIIGNSPIEVQVGSTTTDTDVTNLIQPQLLGSTDGQLTDIDTNLTLVSTGGFNTSNEATFIFTYEGTYNSITVQNSFVVNVVDDITQNSSVVNITANDPTNVLVNSDFDEFDTPKAQATSNNGTITSFVTVYNDVEIDVVKDGYTIIYYAIDTNGAEGYLTITVNVKDDVDGENAQLIASDKETTVSNAPTSDADIISDMDVIALDLDNSDITSDVYIIDYDGYDPSSPTEGIFEITFEVEGNNGVLVQQSATLTVLEDGTTPIYDAEIIGNSPITVSVNSGDDVEALINAQLVGYTDTQITEISNNVTLIANDGYDNTVEGTYNFVYEADYNGVTVQNYFVVNVTSDPVSSSEVVITADDPVTVLKGSTFNPIVTPNAQATSETDGDITANLEVIYNEVDTQSVKDGYLVTYHAVDSTGAESYLTIKVNVIEDIPGENAIIFASDDTEYLSNAPTSETDIITLLDATATENDGTDISSDIYISDLGGYDLADPELGTFEITFAVKGQNNVVVETMAKLTILVDGAVPIYDTVIVGTSPITVQVNSTTDVEELIDAKMIGYKNGDVEIVSDDVSLVTNNGFDISITGTYFFIYEGTYEGLTAREVFEVNVVDQNINESEVEITADDPTTIIKGSSFDEFETPNAQASSNGGTITDFEVIYNDVDVDTVSENYSITYYAVDSNGATSYKTIQVIVKDKTPGEDAQITSSDKNVILSQAPSDEDAIKVILEANAIDVDGTDLTSEITVFDLGGYDPTSPAIGSYEITFTVKGDNNVVVESISTLNIVADNTDPFYEAQLIGNDPINISLGDSTTLYTDLINPQVVGYINGDVEEISNTTIELVSDGGFDYNTEGTYYVTYQGTYEGLTVTNTFVVNVIDGAVSSSQVNITADNPVTIIVNSTFDPFITPNAQASSEGSTISQFIVFDDGGLDTTTVGSYDVTYYAQDENGASAYETITVNVVVDSYDYPQIFANDLEVNYSDRPLEEDLISAMDVVAYDKNGSANVNPIQIVDLDGYDYDTVPTTGETYEITYSVKGSNDVTKEVSVTLTVVDDSTEVFNLNIIGNEPIHIQKGDNVDPTDFINPQAVLRDSSDAIVSVTSLSTGDIINDGGYDYTTTGTYEIVYETTIDGRTAQNSFTVIVVDDEVGSHSFVEITADDPTKVLQFSTFDEMITPNPEAISRHSTIDEFTYVYSDVDTDTLGTYEVTYYANDLSGAESYLTISVEVVAPTPGEDATLRADDSEVLVADAPKTKEELFTLMNVTAYEANGKDITSDVEIQDLDGYDYSNPVADTYDIVYYVEGRNGVIVQVTKTLTVKDSGEVYTAEIIGSTPVTVIVNDGTTTNDLNDIILPKLIEYTDANITDITQLTFTDLSSDGGYDNTVVGTYYLTYETTSSEGLDVTGIFEVNVIIDDGTQTSSDVVITADDPVTIIKGSTFDPILTPNTVATSTNGTISDIEIISNTVDTSAVGSYEVTYYAYDDTGAESYLTITVNVVDETLGEDATIKADDSEVLVTNAPTDQDELFSLMDVEAYEADGTDITSDVEVNDLDGYNYSNPAKGTYEISYKVVGDNGVLVQTSATLIVKDSGDIHNADLVGTSAITVRQGDSSTEADITSLIDPKLVEYTDGDVTLVSVVSDSELVNNGGYDNNDLGTYYFKYETTSSEGLTVSEVFEVNVIADDGEETASDVVITATDNMKVLVDSVWNDFTTPNAEAVSNGSTIDEFYVLYGNVDTTTVGTYELTYYANDLNGSESYLTITVEVVEETLGEDATIKADDSQVLVADAPQNDSDLFSLMDVEAYEADGTDITSDVVVEDFDSYDYSSPAAGSYDITYSVTGENGVTVQTIVRLVVKNSGTIYSADLVGTSAITVRQGDTSTEADITSLIDPKLVEYTDGDITLVSAVSDSELVNNGGYDNDTIGIYYFKYETTSSEGLTVSEVFEVNVIADDGEETASDVVITATDNMKVLVDSVWNDFTTPNAEAVSNGSTIDEFYVLYGSVDTTTVGTYELTYYANDLNGSESYLTITVEVVKETLGEDATIKADDSQVLVANAPQNDSELFSLMDVEAYEADGTDVTSDVVIQDFDSYDYSSPAVGIYEITFNVTGENGVTIQTTATLEVKNSGVIHSADLVGTSAITVRQGDLSSVADITSLIDPKLIEFENNVATSLTDVNSSELVNDGGYDNNTIGTYYFKYETTSSEGLTVSGVFEVNVIADDGEETVSDVVITATDNMKVLVNSTWNDFATPNAEAVSNGSTIDEFYVLYGSVDTTTVGTYELTYYANDLNGSESYLTITVEVVNRDPNNDALLSANDTTLRVSDAPTDQDDLLIKLNVQALDYNGDILTNEVVVQDLGGFDYDNPAIGNYDIILNVTGDSGVTIQTTVTLTLVDNDQDVSSLEIVGNNPINVIVNDGTTLEQAVDLMDAYVLGYVNGELTSVDNSTISVANTVGYDNTTVGTYYVNLTGDFDGLTTSKIFVINVIPDNGEVTSSAVSIDGLDPTNLIVNDPYTPIITSRVVADSQVDGDITSDIVVVEDTVDNEQAGTYYTVYTVVDSEGNTATKVITVNVVDYDASQMGSIVASDYDLLVNSATGNDDSYIKELLSVKSTDVDGSDITNITQVDGYTNLSTRSTAIIDSNIDYTSIFSTVGSYEFFFSVEDNTGTVIQTSAVLNVVDEEVEFNNYFIEGNSPIYVLNGDATTIDELTDLINPIVIDEDNESVNNSEITLISDGGYDNNADGTYTFIYETTIDGKTIQNSFDVIVNDSLGTAAGVTIDADELVSVQVNTSFNELTDVNLSAFSLIDGDVTSLVTYTSNVDINTIGTYEVTYTVIDSAGNSAIKNITVVVYGEDVVIDGEDVTVDITDAPSSLEELEDLIDLIAVDNGTDVTDNVEIENVDNYDFDNPESGTYSFEVTYTGVNGETITETFTITLTEEEEEDNSPIITDTGVKYSIGAILIIVIVILFIIIFKRRKKSDDEEIQTSKK